MGKKSKNKQRQSGLVTAPVKASTPVAPIRADGPMPAVAAPIKAPVVRPAAPTIVREEVVQPGTGVIMGRIYSPTGKVLYGRIYEKAKDSYYTTHSKVNEIPTEGTIINFEVYQFDNRDVAKITKVGGTDQLVTARLNSLNKLPVYRIMQMQDYLNSEGTDIENVNVVGSTPEGMILYYEKESRQ